MLKLRVTTRSTQQRRFTAFEGMVDLYIHSCPMYIQPLTQEWIRYYFHCWADRAPRVEVPVFKIKDGKACRTGRNRSVYGIAALHQHSRLVEVVIPEPREIAQLERCIVSTVRQVHQINPALHLCPSHSGWIKRLQGGKTRIDLLFAETGESEIMQNPNYSRRNSLDFHLQTQSRKLGVFRKVHVVRGDSPISRHDGVIYFQAAAFEVMPPSNPVKVIGFTGFSSQQLKEQAPVIKGMARVLDSGEWTSLCTECGVDPSADALVPECTVKFDNGRSCLESVTFFMVFDTVASHRATISIQAAGRVPLTPYGEKILVSTFRQRNQEVMDAYHDTTGMTVAGLMDHDFKEMKERSILGEESECEDADYFLEKAEVLSATLVALMTGLPMDASEYLNATLPALLRNRTKHVPVPGLTMVALPDSTLGPNQVLVPWKEAKRLGIQPGDRVTVMRYPNTGIEMAEVAVCGLVECDAVFIQPEWWAERFAGDFDGDLIGLIPAARLIDEGRIHDAKSPKLKGSGAMTIVQAVARSFFAKLIIPSADAVVTICAEHDRDLTQARGLLQAVVDSIKHVVDLPSIPETLKGLDLPEASRPSPIATIVRGRLGSAKKECALRYNTLVASMNSVSSGLPFLSALEEEFQFIISPNRKYAELCYLGLDARLKQEYVNALHCAGQDDLIRAERNKEALASFSPELVRATRAGALREAARIRGEYPESVQLAYTVLRLYSSWIACLKVDALEEAYGYLAHAREMLAKDEITGGYALRYLFIALVYRADPSIALKSLKILSYLPVKLGVYDLAGYIRKLDYTRCFDVRVVERATAVGIVRAS